MALVHKGYNGLRIRNNQRKFESKRTLRSSRSYGRCAITTIALARSVRLSLITTVGLALVTTIGRSTIAAIGLATVAAGVATIATVRLLPSGGGGSEKSDSEFIEHVCRCF